MTDITRRDFLNGVALTIAAGLTPAAQIMAQPLRYPPALTGMRGHHAGSFEIGHDLRDGKTFALDGVPIEERYDLVVVGGGISGLAAAWFYRRAKPQARILILDNHDDFGGHAKRNEFRSIGRLIIGYGGSESMQSPKALYSSVAKGLLKELGVDIARFETAFERRLYPSLGLSRGVFFPRETFGRDVLATGDPTSTVADDLGRSLLNAKPLARLRRPVPDLGRQQGAADRALSAEQRSARGQDQGARRPKSSSARAIATISSRFAAAARRSPNCFQGRTLDFFAVGCDAVAGRRRARRRLSRVRRARPPHCQQPGAERALYLSFPRRQRVARAAARARADPGRGARHDHGRHRAGAVRLRQARRGRRTGAHPSRQHLRPCPQCRQRRRARLYPRRQAASRRRSARGARLLPHGHSLHHAGAVARRSARRWRRTSRRHWSTPTCWCATGMPG